MHNNYFSSVIVVTIGELSYSTTSAAAALQLLQQLLPLLLLFQIQTSNNNTISNNNSLDKHWTALGVVVAATGVSDTLLELVTEAEPVLLDDDAEAVDGTGERVQHQLD